MVWAGTLGLTAGVDAAVPLQARLDVAHTKQAESEGGRQQALKAVQEAWKQIDDLRADVRTQRSRVSTMHTALVSLATKRT